MGGMALLARQLGIGVSGSDANVYPPMSTQLEEQGIALCEGYQPANLEPRPDCVVIGNAMSRGNPAVEYALDNNLAYTSGPQWLFTNWNPISFAAGVPGVLGGGRHAGAQTATRPLRRPPSRAARRVHRCLSHSC